MSNKETENYYNELRKELVECIETGNKVREIEIREELEDAGFVLEDVEG